MRISLITLLIMSLLTIPVLVWHSASAQDGTPVVKPKTAKEVKEGEAPVVTPSPAPKKTDKDTPEENMAVLPMTFVKNRIEVMPVNVKGYVSPEAIKCDSQRRCWLNPDTIYGTAAEGRVVQVSKGVDGYHMILDKVDHQWVAQELPAGVKWLPVKTITVPPRRAE